MKIYQDDAQLQASTLSLGQLCLVRSTGAFYFVSQTQSDPLIDLPLSGGNFARLMPITARDLVVGSIDLADYAQLDSPAFVGTPTAPTPAESDDSTRIATTAFVRLLGTGVVEEGSNANGNYRIWSSGHIEQWRDNAPYNALGSVTTTFPVSFGEAPTVVATTRTTYNGDLRAFATKDITTTTFVALNVYSTDSTAFNMGYVAKGY